ncbi:MAG: hypothetical protein AB7E49_01100 [Campylobacterales bacterium]
MRKTGTEAPAVRLKNAQGQERIVGMMNLRHQVLCYRCDEATLGFLAQNLAEHEKKVWLAGIECAPCSGAEILLDPEGEFARRCDMPEESVMVIDTEGTIVFTQSPVIAEEVLSAVRALLAPKKKKGHSHENWMRA